MSFPKSARLIRRVTRFCCVVTTRTDIIFSLHDQYFPFLCGFEDALSHTEQEIRVAGVHQYLSRQILPIMRLTPPIISHIGLAPDRMMEDTPEKCLSSSPDNLIIPSSAVRPVSVSA